MQPQNRIGCKKEGAEEIKRHPFFKDIDWDKLLLKQVVPPFIPETHGSTDTSNVDSEFTDEMPQETPVMESDLSTNRDVFDNFSFVNDSNVPKMGS